MLSSALLHNSTWEVAAYTHLGTMYTPLQIAIMAYRRIADKQACKGRRQQGAERLPARAQTGMWVDFKSHQQGRECRQL